MKDTLPESGEKTVTESKKNSVGETFGIMIA
jgi:hypothetical protein